MEDFGRAFARGRAAYPRLKVEPEPFRRHLARSLEAQRGKADKDLPIEDLYLACACAAGVKGAAAAFEVRYAVVMHRAVARVLPSPAEQEEVVQRARQLLLVGEEGRPPKIATYRGNGPLESWVAVSTIRLAVSLGRADTAERRLRERAGVDAMGPDAENLLIKSELRREFEAAVRAALAGLEKRARLVLRLYLVGGMSLAAIGKTFRVTQQTVSRWLAQTRDDIVTDVQHRLAERLKIAREDLPSIARLVASQLDVSISRLLGTQKT